MFRRTVIMKTLMLLVMLTVIGLPAAAVELRGGGAIIIPDRVTGPISLDG